MAKSIMMGFQYGGASTPDGSTRYYACIGELSSSSTEANQVEVPVRESCTVSNLYIRVVSTTITVSDSATATVRKSRANTSITCSWAANITGVFTDDSNTASFANTDEFCVAVVAPADPGGAYNLRLSICACTFDGSGTNTYAIRGMAISGQLNDESGSYYFQPAGRTNEGSGSAGETAMQQPLRAAFTVKALQCYVSSVRATASTLKTRKNGGDGNCSISITTTGWFEDTDSSDSYAVDDNFCIAVVLGTGTDNLAIGALSCAFISAAGYAPYMIAGNTGISVDSYFALSQYVLNPPATEAEGAILPQFTFTVTNLQAYTTTSGAYATMRVRDNLANGNNVITWSNETGLKHDATHEDVITGGTDELCFWMGNISIQSTITWASFLGTTVTAVAPSAISAGCSKADPTVVIAGAAADWHCAHQSMTTFDRYFRRL